MDASLLDLVRLRASQINGCAYCGPAPSAEMQRLAAALHDHGAKSDLMESRAALAEKRTPSFKGWNDPQDRYRLPTMETAKG